LDVFVSHIAFSFDDDGLWGRVLVIRPPSTSRA
jgi:hypothetical protein